VGQRSGAGEAGKRWGLGGVGVVVGDEQGGGGRDRGGEEEEGKGKKEVGEE